MEKETFIYNALKNICGSDKSQKQKLHDVAEWVYRNRGVKLYFCEILGSRWSFFSGFDGMIVPEERIKITDTFGILVEKSSADCHNWDEILSAVKRIIMEGQSI